MEDTLTLLLGSCFVLVGVLTGAFFCYRIYLAGSSQRWPFVLGDLESADLREAVYRGREVGGGADQASAWRVDFKYSYTVADTKYQGTRVTFSDSVNKTMRSLRALQNHYRGRSQVKVYYNPKNPAQSLLLPGLSVFNFTPLITSALFIAAGVFIQTYDFS